MIKTVTINSVKKLLISIVSLLSLANIANAGETCADIKGFADYLYNQQDYYRAITEYKKYIYMCPSVPDIGDAMLKIGYSYKSGRQYDAAIFTFSELLDSNIDDVSRSAHYQLAKTYMLKGFYTRAIDIFDKCLDKFTDPAYRNDSLYDMSWAYIEERDYKGAVGSLSKINGAMKYTATALSADMLEASNAIPYRSPVAAGIFSGIVPGAGQAYTGRYGDAFFSLFLNGLFAAGAYEAYIHKEYAVLGIVGFFGIGWYSGNIYGAITDAYHFNDEHNAEYIDSLKIKYGYH